MVTIKVDDQRLDIAEALCFANRARRVHPRQVMTQPQTRGMPKRSCSPIAEPTTSARSHAAMASSQRTHCPQTTGLGVMIAAGLREVAPRDDAELDAEMLEQDRHQVGNHDDAEQRVAELRAAREVGGPIAGIHVTHRHEKAGTREGQQLSPERCPGGNRDAAMTTAVTPRWNSILVFGAKDLKPKSSRDWRYMGFEG